MSRKCLMILGIGLGLVGYGWGCQAINDLGVMVHPSSLDEVQEVVQRKFSTVRPITPARLDAQLMGLSRDREDELLIFDLRQQSEFEVSHLCGARRIDPGCGADALNDVPKDRPIIVYCSVGYRSGAFGQRLVEAGFTRVSNLEGGIFRWAIEGRPLVDMEGRKVKVVHPYNPTWGRLLKPEVRASLNGGK